MYVYSYCSIIILCYISRENYLEADIFLVQILDVIVVFFVLLGMYEWVIFFELLWPSPFCWWLLHKTLCTFALVYIYHWCTYISQFLLTLFLAPLSWISVKFCVVLPTCCLCKIHNDKWTLRVKEQQRAYFAKECFCILSLLFLLCGKWISSLVMGITISHNQHIYIHIHYAYS